MRPWIFQPPIGKQAVRCIADSEMMQYQINRGSPQHAEILERYRFFALMIGLLTKITENQYRQKS